MNSRIGDRFDLTLECIRRSYLGQPSPLFYDLQRYSQFFALFENFPGYVDFFLLQDLVSDDYREVQFYLPFDDFQCNPIPVGLEQYAAYLGGVCDFADKRANRIRCWCRDYHQESQIPDSARRDLA